MTAAPPHTASGADVGRVMRQVMLALIPGTAAMTWFFGWGVLINLAIAAAVAAGAEALMLQMRGRDSLPALADGSALVCAWLLALALPPLSPWWLTAIGSAFAIIVGKQLFGGLGHNLFNPAMAAYAALIVSFPDAMTRWLPVSGLAETSLGFVDTLYTVFSGNPPTPYSWDALTQATPLDALRTGLTQMRTLAEIRSGPLFGSLGGRGFEWIAGAYLLGGLWLLYRRVIDWRIPTAVLLAVFSIAAIFSLIDTDTQPSPLFHWFSGASMLCAFFIATDPVSASTTPLGRWIYGAGIGLLIFLIRSFGVYPDGVAFAVLIMNSAVPLIDRHTLPGLSATGASGMMRADLWRPAALLATFAAVSAGLLAGVQHLTEGRIHLQREAGILLSLNEIVPPGSYDNDLLHDAIALSDPALGPEARLPAWRARRDGRPQAIIMTVLAPDGYGGPIRLLVGIAADGRLLGVRTLAHHETPSLGDGIDLALSPWILSFDAHSLEDTQPAGWTVRRDGGLFDQFSGATITPHAVVRAVHRALLYFKAQQDHLFSAPASSP